VYGIVSQSGGHVRLESQPGKGATFRVFLPRVEPGGLGERAAESTGDGASAARLAASGSPGQRQTVLLVEDADRVRAVVREILEMHGYSVIEGRRGAEALTLSARHPGPIHLLLTDVVMPEMSGRELAERLLPTRPAMRVLYMSGYTDDAIVRHGVVDAGMALITKPFTPDALVETVRATLDAARGGAPPAPPR
jgi:CheY-like chemotaxis protein